MRQFVAMNESEVLEEAIEAFEKESGETLYAGDERRLIINSFMYIAKIITEKANYVANQYLIQTADEPHLLEKGSGMGVNRLEAEKALVEVEFMLSTPKNINITIPAGTRVTADGVVFFAVIENTVIPSGETSVTTVCEATTAGTSGNGYEIGSITTLCDTILYVTAVSNTSESTGGTEIEGIEDYRIRCLLKPYNYNTAGASEAYKYLALSADNTIGSVSVLSSDSDVTITVLCKDGSIPNSLILDRIKDTLSDKSVKPITDHIIVQAPTTVPYSIDVSYTISNADKALITTIQNKVLDSLHEYVKSLAELGKSVNPDEIRKFMMNAGACTVTVNQPTNYVSVSGSQVASLQGEIVCTYTGLC